MWEQIYGAALHGLAGGTKQVFFSTGAACAEANGMFADSQKHEHAEVDVLPRKLAF